MTWRACGMMLLLLLFLMCSISSQRTALYRRASDSWIGLDEVEVNSAGNRSTSWDIPGVQLKVQIATFASFHITSAQTPGSCLRSDIIS